jgi:hypothetical protein
MSDDLKAKLGKLQDYANMRDVQVYDLTKERDQAQSMVQAWEHVFDTLEAHIMDRVAMKDPANPELYLSILRSSYANIKRESEQICAARWADYKRQQDQIDALEALNGRS